MQSQHLQEVIMERNNEGMCGYPCCKRKPRSDMTEFRILFTKRKVVDTKEMRRYCCDECMIRSRYFATQLSEEPVYLRGYVRGLGRPPTVRLLPMNQDLGQMLEHAHDYSPDVSLNKLPSQDQPISTIGPDNPIPKATPSVENYVELLISSLPKSVEKLEIHERSIVEKPTPPEATAAPTINVTHLFKNESTEKEKPVVIKKKSLHPASGKAKKATVFKSQAVVEKRPTPVERVEDVSITVLRPDDYDAPTDVADDASFGFISDADVESDYEMDDDDDGGKEYEKSDVDMSASAMSDVSYASPDPRSAPSPALSQPLLRQLKLSSFGSIWTWFDRSVTIETRRYLSKMGQELRDRHRVPSLPRPNSESAHVNTPASADGSVMRREILSQSILSTFAMIRSSQRVDALQGTDVEDGLVAIVATLSLNESVGKWSEKELWIMTLVLLRCLASHRIPKLLNLAWERLASKGGMSVAQIQAIVDVFKLDDE